MKDFFEEDLSHNCCIQHSQLKARFKLTSRSRKKTSAAEEDGRTETGFFKNGSWLDLFSLLGWKKELLVVLFLFLRSWHQKTNPQKLDPKRQLIKNENLHRLSFFYTQQQFFRLLQECPQHTLLTTKVL